MNPKNSFRISFACLTIAAGLLIANIFDFQKEETLYPVQAVETETAVTPADEANPFLPISAELPLPTVERPQTDAVFAALLDSRDIKLSAFSPDPAGVDERELNHCKALVEQTLAALPAEITASLDTLTLYFSERNPRGLANSHTVELRCTELPDKEIVSVFVHELGHVIDLGHLRGYGRPSEFRDGSLPIASDDPSTKFYGTSWETSDQQRFTSERLDFVSGYAMSDPFEDFAESFNFYVLHGDDFRQLARESSRLQAKYDFLRDEVFEGQEFKSAVVSESEERVWDTTILEYDTAEFFARG